MKKPLLNQQPRQDTPLWGESGLIQEEKEKVWVSYSFNKSLREGIPGLDSHRYMWISLFSGHKAIQNFINKWTKPKLLHNMSYTRKFSRKSNWIYTDLQSRFNFTLQLAFLAPRKPMKTPKQRLLPMCFGPMVQKSQGSAMPTRPLLPSLFLWIFKCCTNTYCIKNEMLCQKYTFVRNYMEKISDLLHSYRHSNRTNRRHLWQQKDIEFNAKIPKP